MLSRSPRLVRTSLMLAAVAAASVANAQPTAGAVTSADYARAEKFLAATLNPLVVGGTVTPTWMTGGKFTYKSTTSDGSRFFVVDPIKKTRVAAFEHVAVAATLSKAAGGTYDAKKFPFQSIELTADGKSVSFDVETKRWSCLLYTSPSPRD